MDKKWPLLNILGGENDSEVFSRMSNVQVTE